MFEYFRLGYGLVTKADPTTENCNLHFAQWLSLVSPIESDNMLLGVTEFFYENMRLKKNSLGLYNRRTGADVRTVSHDEITGWMVSSYLLGSDHRFEVWKSLKKGLGSYNNTGELLNYLPFNPANFYNWGQYVNSKLSVIFAPLYFFNLWLACRKPPGNTSSKLVYWVELNTVPDSFLNRLFLKFYEKRMKAMYGEQYLRRLLDIYFWHENINEFPLHVEARK